MGKQSNRQMIVYLPLVVLATFVVAVCPLILVWRLRQTGAVSSVWAAVGLGAALSFGASYLGAALWKTRTHSEDILFGELMLWGWVQRWRIERRLAAATDLLGIHDGIPGSVEGGRLTDEQRADLLARLASALEARDPYTHGHSRRVARHASSIAKRMGLAPEEIAKVRTAAAMHDVGKVKTPIAVLHKEGKLTDEEFDVIKRHPGEGAAMVSMLRDDELTAMVRHHHERLDGTGYPQRLGGDAIPIGARIIAVADTFDAITSTRAYRSAHAHKRALDILHSEAGTQLDPDAVKAFCSCYSGMRPLAVWTLLASAPQRLVSWFGGGLGSANAASMVNVMGTAATTAVVGGVVLGSIVHPPAHSHRALRTAAVESAALATGHRAESARPALHASGRATAPPPHTITGSNRSGCPGRRRADATHAGGHPPAVGEPCRSERAPGRGSERGSAPRSQHLPAARRLSPSRAVPRHAGARTHRPSHPRRSWRRAGWSQLARPRAGAGHRHSHRNQPEHRLPGHRAGPGAGARQRQRSAAAGSPRTGVGRRGRPGGGGRARPWAWPPPQAPPSPLRRRRRRRASEKRLRPDRTATVSWCLRSPCRARPLI